MVTRGRLLYLIISILCLNLSAFQAFAFPTNFKTEMSLSSAKISAVGQTVKIYNNTDQPIVLTQSKLIFYYQGTIDSIFINNDFQIKTQLGFKASNTLSHHAGSEYTINFIDPKPATLEPGQFLQLKLNDDKLDQPRGFRFYTADPVPVDVAVTVQKANYTQVINICNKSTKSIPLKNIMFSFNFSGPKITSVWGSPWVNWQVSNQTGSAYQLRGGTPYAADLPADPNCLKSMTIQFSSTPTSPLPTGPFVFKSEGATPVGLGSIKVSLPGAPTANLPTPTVTVRGSSFTKSQLVPWGQSWQLNDLNPGAYTITASKVDNGTNYYQHTGVQGSVLANRTLPVTVMYGSVPTGSLQINFINAPTSTIPLILTGVNYSFNKTVTSGMKLTLPVDRYGVSSSIPGFTASITPNPVTIPTNVSVNIDFKKTLLGSILGGYFESWSTPYSSKGSDTTLANLPSYVNYVYLAFMKPDSNYNTGSYDFSPTGLQFNYPNGQVLKDAIALLHQKNPKTKVLVSVGGASYNNWQMFNPAAIARFVKDFGLDGVDIDFEAPNPNCVKNSSGQINCQIDALYQNIIQSMRASLPRPYLITVAAWSIGAYGEGQWANSRPAGAVTGMMLPFFRSATSKAIDMVNVMSYDADISFIPTEALAAYSYYFPGIISMGVEVPPEAWGNHIYTLAAVDKLTKAVLANAPERNTPPGMMMWSLQKNSGKTPTADYPNAQMIVTQLCTTMGLANCSSPLFAQQLAEPRIAHINSTELFSNGYKKVERDEVNDAQVK